MPSRMDGSKPPDWTGMPDPSLNQNIEQIELDDSDSDGIWSEANYHIRALQNDQIHDRLFRAHNESINREISLIRQGARTDAMIQQVEREHTELLNRENREQNIRIRRYQEMRREIRTINGMSNPSTDDINDLRDLLQSSQSLYNQIGEHIRNQFRY